MTHIITKMINIIMLLILFFTASACEDPKSPASNKSKIQRDDSKKRSKITNSNVLNSAKLTNKKDANKEQNKIVVKKQENTTTKKNEKTKKVDQQKQTKKGNDVAQEKAAIKIQKIVKEQKRKDVQQNQIEEKKNVVVKESDGKAKEGGQNKKTQKLSDIKKNKAGERITKKKKVKVEQKNVVLKKHDKEVREEKLTNFCDFLKIKVAAKNNTVKKKEEENKKEKFFNLLGKKSKEKTKFCLDNLLKFNKKEQEEKDKIKKKWIKKRKSSLWITFNKEAEKRGISPQFTKYGKEIKRTKLEKNNFATPIKGKKQDIDNMNTADTVHNTSEYSLTEESESVKTFKIDENNTVSQSYRDQENAFFKKAFMKNLISGKKKNNSIEKIVKNKSVKHMDKWEYWSRNINSKGSANFTEEELKKEIRPIWQHIINNGNHTSLDGQENKINYFCKSA